MMNGMFFRVFQLLFVILSRCARFFRLFFGFELVRVGDLEFRLSLGLSRFAVFPGASVWQLLLIVIQSKFLNIHKFFIIFRICSSQGFQQTTSSCGARKAEAGGKATYPGTGQHGSQLGQCATDAHEGRLQGSPKFTDHGWFWLYGSFFLCFLTVLMQKVGCVVGLAFGSQFL